MERKIGKKEIMIALLLVVLFVASLDLPKVYAYDAEVYLTVIKKETNEILAQSGPVYCSCYDWFEIYETYEEPPSNTTTKDIIRITKVLVIGAGLITGTITANIFGAIITIAVAATSTKDYEISIPPSNGTGSVSIHFKGQLIPSDVGGYVIPVDKFVLLAPYIGLASITIIAAVITVVYVKRIKRRREE